MNFQLTHQIQIAERGIAGDRVLEGRFVPRATPTVRSLSARLIRTGACSSLRLADRLDHRFA